MEVESVDQDIENEMEIENEPIKCEIKVEKIQDDAETKPEIVEYSIGAEEEVKLEANYSVIDERGEEMDQEDEIQLDNNNGEEYPLKAKRLPEKYSEIYESYKCKEFSKCLEIIESVKEGHIEYQILKSACLIELGNKLTEAHEILDLILDKHPNNAYTVYAKGLAYFHEAKYEDSIEYFEKARELDQSKDMERAEIMKRKAEAKFNASLLPSQPQYSSVSYKMRKFTCELCGHVFGKKFNLDRHYQSIHKNPSIKIIKKSIEKVKNVSKTPKSQNKQTSMTVDKSPKHVKETPESVDKSPKQVKQSKNKTGSKSNFLSLSLTERSNRSMCRVCKKLFPKSSLGRHMIIHTGNKPHKCNQCYMAFYQKSDLNRHVATHSDELNHACDLCDKRFRIKKNLQVHKRRHHSS